VRDSPFDTPILESSIKLTHRILRTGPHVMLLVLSLIGTLILLIFLLILILLFINLFKRIV
jgi:hypothetical protein